MIADNDPKPASRQAPPAPLVRAAAIRIAVLAGLLIWALWPEMRAIANSLFDGQNPLSIALPLAILILFLLRRQVLRQSVAAGSSAGVLVVFVGLIWYSVCVWPFDYGFLRLLAVPVLLGGCILAAAGGRALKHSLPLLLMLAFALPVGPRIYAALIIRPETATLKVARAAFDALPGVNVSLKGSDLVYSHGQSNGVIALGESYRGMALLGSYTLIGGFVVFARIRPLWQIVLAGLAAGPIVLLANFIRLLTWGFATIYGGYGPTSELPRDIAAAVSMLSAFFMFAIWCLVLSQLVVEADESPDMPETAEVADV
ncbi:MAG TPA: archaeosortase/exosortase family protein [Phycisphaerae bacterium]|nr:archaeosortase/exosortase family protein [Phycisphaerae bacterium]